MSLVDLLTGGADSEAKDYLRQAQDALKAVNVPSAESLSLPELQKYVNAGVLTPAQAQAILQQGNAYDSATGSQGAREAEMTALSQLQDVSQSGGMTPQMQAQLTSALDQANTNTQGTRGSILDSFAARGIPTSLMAGAMQQAAASQDARTANLAGTQAAGQAEQNALSAMANSGNLAGNIENQQFGEQAQKAQAQNAINQWNAQNQTQNNQFNAGNQQQANIYNTTNQQEVSNQNTGLTNARTQYNAQVPETVFNNQLQKATGQANVSGKQADQAMQAGQQEAGLIGGLIGGASQMGAAGLAPTPQYNFGEVPKAAEGGMVNGHPEVQGDSPRNDTVPAMLSPGEVVVPRSIASNPDAVKQFVAHLMKQGRQQTPVHPEDVRTVLDALSHRREGSV